MGVRYLDRIALEEALVDDVQEVLLFGEAGEGFLRFCYAAAEEEIVEALERLAPALRELA